MRHSQLAAAVEGLKNIFSGDAAGGPRVFGLLVLQGFSAVLGSVFCGPAQSG